MDEDRKEYRRSRWERKTEYRKKGKKKWPHNKKKRSNGEKQQEDEYSGNGNWRF